MDHNNKYFQSVAKIKTYKQSIQNFTSKNNVVLHSQQDITEAVTNEMSQRFSKNVTRDLMDDELQIIPSIVVAEDNIMLTKPPTMHELREAVFSQPKGKTPGPDGSLLNFTKAIGILSRNRYLRLSKRFFILVRSEERRVGEEGRL